MFSLLDQNLQERKIKTYPVPISNVSKSPTNTGVLLVLEKGRMWFALLFPVNAVPLGPTFGGKYITRHCSIFRSKANL